MQNRNQPYLRIEFVDIIETVITRKASSIMKSNATPLRHLEHFAVAEYLLLPDAIYDMPGRKNDYERAWGVLKDIATES